MIKDESDFEKIVNQLNIDTKSNPAHREKLRGQMLSAFNKASRQTLRNTIMKSPITKLAAAAAIIIAIFTAIHYFGGPVNITAPVFADVIEQIYQAHSVIYKKTFYPGQDNEFTAKKMINESGIIRSELPHGGIMILDFSSGKDLHLIPDSKRFILTQRVGSPRRKKLFNYLDWVSKIHEKEGVFTGQQELDGEITNVFVVEVPFEKTTVWVNPETNLPVRVKMQHWPNPNNNIIMPKMSLNLSDFGGNANETTTISIGSGRGSGEGIQDEITMVFSDFVWNIELDEGLFSLEPPEGYAVEESQLDVSKPDENGLIEALAFWAEMSDGIFPSQINDLCDPNKSRPLLIAKFDRDGNPKEEFKQAVQQMNKLLKGLMFAQRYKVDGSWNYTGEGVKLGDADTPIIWYRPEGSETYRIIYGDLSVMEVASDNLLKQAVETDQLVALDIELPKPMFVGTPLDSRVPNLEKPLGKPRPPFYAPVGTKNVALGKPVSSSDEEPIIGEVEMITDGDKEATDGSYIELGPSLQHVTIDLEAIHEIYAIVIWHYHKQACVYFDVVVQVADDADFITNARTLFNNDIDNSAGLGVGKDMHYVETHEGKLIDAKGARARYVRLYSNGSNGNDLNHYIEVSVYGKPAK